MKRKNEKDWDLYGMLVALEGPEIFIVKQYLKQIDLDKFESSVDDGVGILIGPCVRCIVCTIIQEKKRLLSIKDNEMSSIILGEVNVDEIVEELIYSCNDLLPILEQSLDNIDAQVELVDLFSKNYVLGLINKVKGKNKKECVHTEES